MKFIEQLLAASKKNDSLLCVGLDTDVSKLPKHLLKADNPVLDFNREIIEATADLVCAYKPNIAFYEALGAEGWRTLKQTIEAIPSHIPVIVDAKRGDIGNTARMYAQAFYQGLGADAVTVNPYMGFDAAEPFLEYPDKCVFVLCLTSNAGAEEFQYLFSEGSPVYEHVAERVVQWSKGGCCGLVVGATRPEQLKKIRQIAPRLPFLIPGIGVQGGDLEASVRWGTDKQGQLAIINSSRGIIYASDGTDFAQKARAATQRLRERINLYRK